MASFFRNRPSAALIVASVALFVALGGSALAATSKNASQHSVAAPNVVASVGGFHSSGSAGIFRGYQETTSTTPVTLMTLAGLGTVKVDCQSSMSRIAFYPSVSGSLWFTHGGSIGFVSGSAGTQLSNQATDDELTVQFATTTQTASMVISGHPGSPCIYAAQAMVQP